MLLDPEYGLDAVLAGAALPKDCGLIVAVDRLDQPSGEPIRSTTFDRSIDLEELTRRGAVALKLLVLWRPAGDPRPTLDLVRGFVEACARAGLVSLVEAVIRDERPWDASRHAATVVAAARELATTEPDVYKAEVPTLGRASLTEIEAAAREVTAALRCPWVVLSNGTSPDAFPDGVRAACRGGASGFLAGRAVWAPAIAGTDRAAHTSEHDLETRLASDAVVRLRTLVEIADSNARPWTAAA
jgi:sulfofructosephosphate aldolase